MKRENPLDVLRKELQFVQKGGYRAPIVWRAPPVFEDSPTCPRGLCAACPETDCVLMRFVPKECRYQAVPCRHIPLNELVRLFKKRCGGESCPVSRSKPAFRSSTYC